MKHRMAILALLVGVAVVCGGAWAESSDGSDTLDSLYDKAYTLCRQAADAADMVYLLSYAGYLPSNAETRSARLMAIVAVYERSGPDVRPFTLGFGGFEGAEVGRLPKENLFRQMMSLNRFGLLLNLSQAGHALSSYVDRARQCADVFAAYYEERYGWDGALILTSSLDQIQVYWRQIEALCRFGFETALESQDSPDDAAVESALLKVNAFATALVGYPVQLREDERSQRWSGLGPGEQDVPCVFYRFFDDLAFLDAQLTEAFFWAAEPQDG